MEYRTLVSEENDVSEGHEQTFSPLFDTQEDSHTSEKRKNLEFLFFKF